MSTPNSDSSATHKQAAGSAANKSAGAPSTFNYAAAAAKSRQQQQQQSQQQQPPSSAAPANRPTQSSAQATSTDGATRSNTPGVTPNGKPAANAPQASSNLNPAAEANTASNNGSKRQSAVSMPKTVPGAGNRQGPGGINFGSVHDSTAMLSSSPAVQPKSGEHLQGDKPALFGSVEASNESKQKVVGFASKEGSAATPRPPMDFQKLFQGGGNKASATATAAATSPKPAAAPASDNAAQQSTTAPAPAAQTSAASSPAPAAAASTPAPAPATDAAASASPPSASKPAQPATGALKPPAANSPAPSTPHHPTAQPFEPQRSPSHFHQQGMRVQAPGGAPFHPHGNPTQQPRSPHMPPAPAMQHMMGAHQGHWHGQQQPVYYPAMGGYPYQYAPPPAGHWPQASQYDMGGAPRSPRHANVPTSSPMPHPPSSAASMAPSTPGAVSSPASSRAQAVPYSPSTTPSTVSSPPPHGHVGLGHPPAARPPAFHAPSGSYGGHAPSQSFGGAGNPMMSPAARQFEPNPKRMSSAIRIVNPETKATVDVGSPAQSGHKSAASTSAAVTPASPSPAPAAASPAAPSNKEAAGTGSPVPAAKKIETAQEFQARVRALAEANHRKKAEATAAKEREAAAAEEAKKKAAEEEEERKRKAEADAEAAKKREEEEKAEAARKAAEEEAARQEAERKEREAKAQAERKEKEAKEAAEAQERAAHERAAAEAAANERAKAAEESARQEEEKKAVETVEQQVKQTPAPIDTRRAENAKLDAQEAVATGEKGGAEAGKDAAAGMTTSRSVADIERMAREASSVPSTPLEGAVGRTPLFPTTPRTPSTPGFAGLPAKPMATLSGTANGTITLDGAQLEKRRRPTQLDTGAAQRSNASSTDAPPMSAASMALGSARFIEDLSKVAYPDNVQSPRAELNETAEPGKFKYDRDFLLQFMNVYSEKPHDMPSLASIGMEQGQSVGGGRGAAGRRASGLGSVGASGSGRGGSLGLGIGGGSGFGRGAGAGAMGQFSHPPKTSEERFAQATAGLRGAPGSAFGASGPMGSFNAGSRTQPLSRGGSGSTALPSREMMGTGAPRTQSRRGKQREPGANSRVNPPEKGGPTIPLDQVVPLARSESRWQAGTGAKLSTDSPEMVQRKVKALLNKLTVEKFASISDQILEWANKSVDEQDGRTLRQVIALIFEKATDEAAWSEMYAQLCRKLMEELSPNVTDESLKGSDGKLVVGGALFRKYLLNRCQEDFERGWAYRDAMVDAAKSKEAEDKAKKESNEKAEADAKAAAERGEKTEAKDAELMSEEYYIAQKAKRRGLGLVRFIGELFKLQMLTERIMHICIKKLLSNATDPEEEEIESLCKLLTTVGRQLDTEKARAHIDIYFQRMTEMSNSPNVNSRMKFMLLDVIEMRAAGWRGKQEAAGPKSIAQIHEDAAKQKQQAEAEMAARTRGAPPSRGGSRRGQQRGEFGGPGGQPVGPDGWTAVGNAPPPPRPTRAGDLSSFGKIERSGSGRPLTLGGPMGGMPNTVFAKKQQKSSEEGSKPPSRTNSSMNMFDLLNQAESSEPSAPAEETRRPKLNLAPRTKPMPGATGADEGEGDKGEGAGDADKEEEEMSEEAANRKIDEDIKEFLEIKDAKEGVLALKSLPSAHRSRFLAKITETVLNKKEADVRSVGKLLVEARSSSLMDDGSLEQGFKDAGISMLDDMSIDVPNVYSFMAILVVQSGLPQESVEKLADEIEGDGLKPPKQRFLEKVTAERESA